MLAMCSNILLMMYTGERGELAISIMRSIDLSPSVYIQVSYPMWRSG